MSIIFSLRDNEEAYNRYKLRPRVLRNVGQVDMNTEIFGVKVREAQNDHWSLKHTK